MQLLVHSWIHEFRDQGRGTDWRHKLQKSSVSTQHLNPWDSVKITCISVVSREESEPSNRDVPTGHTAWRGHP